MLLEKTSLLAPQIRFATYKIFRSCPNFSSLSYKKDVQVKSSNHRKREYGPGQNSGKFLSYADNILTLTFHFALG